MSSESEPDLIKMFLTKTSRLDYKELCRLDVLELEDRLDGDQNLVYEDFKEQLVRSPGG